MRVRNNVFYSLALVVADIIALMLAFGIAYIIRVQFDPRPLLTPIYAKEFFLTFLFIAPLWVIVLASLGLYDRNIWNRRLSEVTKLLIGSFIGILLVIGYSFVSGHAVFPARLVAVYAFIGSFVLLVLERSAIHSLRAWLLKNGRGMHRLLVIGNSEATRDVIDQLRQTSRTGYFVSAVAGPKKIVPEGLDTAYYPNPDQALKVVEQLHITAIIQTDLFEDQEKNQRILTAAQTHHIDYSFIPSEAEFYSGKNTVDVFLGYPMISVSQTPLIGWGEIAKQVFDLIVGLFIFIVTSPLLILLVLLQKIFNPGPIFYRPVRLSRYSDQIKIYKFRSMSPKYGKKDAADEFREMGRKDLAREYDINRKVKNDPRITKFGRFLRTTSLDELPQIFNVLRGELSLVGPRPILPQEMKLVKGKASLLHSVKSGVTGLWQVSGRSDLSFDKRIELEMYYAQNWSFWLDIKILLKTVKVVFRRSGAE